MTPSYRDLELVCRALGLTPEQKKKGVLWSGIANGKFARLVIHKHSNGRDIPNGTFHQAVKELGFQSEKEFFDFLNSI